MTVDLETAVALAFFGHLDLATVPDLAREWIAAGQRSEALDDLAAGVGPDFVTGILWRAWRECGGTASVAGEHVRPALVWQCRRLLAGSCEADELFGLCADVERVLAECGGDEGELDETFQYLLHDHRLLRAGWAGLEAAGFAARLHREAERYVAGDSLEPAVMLPRTASDGDVDEALAACEPPALRTLQLPRAHRETLERFGRGPAVVDLVLDEPALEDWSVVTRWPELRRLSVLGGRGSGSLSSFVDCPSLKSLSVSGWQELVSTAGVERCRNLAWLGVGGAALRDLAGVEALPLEVLSVRDAPGLREVSALASVRTLRVLALTGTPLPGAVIERLRAALPVASLTFTPSDARLGIPAGADGRWNPGEPRPQPVR